MCENSSMAQTNWILILKTCRIFIKESTVDSDLGQILDELLEHNVITFDDKDIISAKTTAHDKLDYVMDIVMRKGSEACFYFLNFFKNKDHLQHIQRKIEEKIQNSSLPEKSECTLSSLKDQKIEELLFNLSSEDKTIEEIRTKRFQESVRQKYGKYWLKVVNKMENEVHPIRKWTQETCGQLKTDSSEQDKDIIDIAEKEIYNAFKGTSNNNLNLWDDIEDMEHISKEHLFKILLQICHGVILKAYKVADETSESDDSTMALFILFEIIEVFKKVLREWECRFFKASKSFPILHHYVELGVDRIGSELFLDLDVRKYLDLKKHKSFKGLTIFFKRNKRNKTTIPFAVKDTQKYWTSFNQNFFEETKINGQTLHQVSSNKVFENIANDHKSFESTTINNGLSEELQLGFYLTQKTHLYPIISKGEKSQNDKDNQLLFSHLSKENISSLDFYHLSKDNELQCSKDSIETNCLVYQMLNLKRSHYAAVQTLFYLLRLKGLDVTRTDIQISCLWLLESDWDKYEHLQTSEDVLAFLDALYSKLSSQLNNEDIPSFINKELNSLTRRDVLQTIKQLYILGKNPNVESIKQPFCLNRQLKDTISVPFTIDTNIFTEENENCEKAALDSERFLLYVCFFLCEILLININTDITFWEVGSNFMFYVSFGCMSAYIFLVIFAIALNNQGKCSIIVSILIFGGLVALQNTNSFKELLNTFFSSNFLNKAKNVRYNSIIFQICGYECVYTLIILAYMKLCITNKTEGIRIRKVKLNSSKVFTYLVTIQQDVSRDAWINTYKFQSNIVPNILIGCYSSFIKMSSIIGQLAESPRFLSYYFKKSFSASSTIVQFLPTCISLICMTLFHLLFQMHHKIYWLIFLVHLIIAITLLFITKSIVHFKHLCPKLTYTNLFMNIIFMKNVVFLLLYAANIVSSVFDKELFRYPYDNLAYNPYTAGISYVDLLPLMLVYTVAHKICSINVDEMAFQKERMALLHQSIQYHYLASNVDKDCSLSLNLNSVFNIFTDLFRIPFWSFTFVLLHIFEYY